MKALTLIQSLATLITMGIKKIETKSWRPNYQGIIAIPAGKKFDKDFFTNPSYQDLINKYNITL